MLINICIILIMYAPLHEYLFFACHIFIVIAPSLVSTIYCTTFFPLIVSLYCRRKINYRFHYFDSGGVDVIIGPSACGHSSCATASVVNNSKVGWYSSDVLLRPNMTRGSGEQGVARRRAPKKSPSCRDRRGHKTHRDINRILRVGFFFCFFNGKAY